MDGFDVMPMAEAAALGYLFITATGCSGVITAEHFEKMKDGAILCNAGHFDVEVDVKYLEENALEKFEARPNIMGYQLPNGRTVFVLAEGRLVNLASGDGHPAEIMDMSFAIQALSARYLVENRDRLPKSGAGSRGIVLPVPKEIDDEVARRKLAAWGVAIDTLRQEQETYLSGWGH